MQPEICKNCCANEFIEQEDAYICAYCNTRYPKPLSAVKPVRREPVPPPVHEPVEEVPAGREKNKWLAFLLCFFLGFDGAHKFYEGRIFMGILYLFTFGLFGIGWIVDCVILLFKPNPYYV